MAIIVSKNSQLNDDLWNEWSDQLIAVLQDTDTEQNDADDFVNSVFNVKKSNKFGEKALEEGESTITAKSKANSTSFLGSYPAFLMVSIIHSLLLSILSYLLLNQISLVPFQSE